MARYKRITKKKSLKEPDEFISFWSRTINWTAKNRDKLLLPILGLVVGVVLISGFFYYKQQKGISSNRELSAILRNYTPQATLALDNSQNISTSLKDFSKKFSGIKLSRVADLYDAHILYGKSDFEGATSAYRRVMDSGSKEDITYSLAARGLANALQEQKQYEESNKILTALRRDGITEFAEEIDLAIARNYELDKNFAEALQEYTRFVEKYPISRQIESANERISVLKAASQ